MGPLTGTEGKTRVVLSESFYTISSEYHRASIRHLGCMTVLAYARIWAPVSMRYIH